MNEDIDWMNASSDLGLVQLCREMAAMAGLVEAKVPSLGTPSKRRRRRGATARGSSASSSAPVHTRVSAA
jgi:hypothetical protein